MSGSVDHGGASTAADAAAGPVAHRHVCVIEVAEAFELDLMLKDPAIGRMGLVRLDATTAAVLPARHDQLVARLRALDMTPKMRGGA